MVQGAPDNIEVTAAGVNKAKVCWHWPTIWASPARPRWLWATARMTVPCWEKAGVAAVMANGMEHIRKLADIVSENDNDHDGVAEIFARLGL